MGLTWSVFWGERTYNQRIAATVAILLAIFQTYTALFGSLDALKQRSIHLGLGLILVFLVRPGSKRKKDEDGPNWLDWLSVGATFIVIVYLLARYDWITVERFSLITPLAWYEKLLGVVAIVLVLEGARRVVSKGLFYCVIVFLFYPFIGPFLPGALHTSPIQWTELVDFDYLSLGGIGSSKRRNRRQHSHPDDEKSRLSPISQQQWKPWPPPGDRSCLLSWEQRPSSCRIWRDSLYNDHWDYAIFPAILYYLSLFVTVDLRARRLRLTSMAPEISLKATLRDYGHMIIPVAVLVYLLVAGYSPRLAGGFGIITAIAASQLRSATHSLG